MSPRLSIGIILFLILIGCNNFQTIILMADEEAVITQEGEIVKTIEGPKVKKISSKQKAHIIKKHSLRVYSYDSSLMKNISITLRWYVLNSNSYYHFSKDKQATDIKEILKSELDNAMISYDIYEISTIAKNQKTNKQFRNKNSEDIFQKLQVGVEKYGIKIHHILYAENS